MTGREIVLTGSGRQKKNDRKLEFKVPKGFDGFDVLRKHVAIERLERPSTHSKNDISGTAVVLDVDLDGAVYVDDSGTFTVPLGHPLDMYFGEGAVGGITIKAIKVCENARMGQAEALRVLGNHYDVAEDVVGFVRGYDIADEARNGPCPYLSAETLRFDQAELRVLMAVRDVDPESSKVVTRRDRKMNGAELLAQLAEMSTFRSVREFAAERLQG